jgi:membrane protein implicated in regulation of membrane protease activity
VITVYLICFVLGLVLSLLACFSGLGRLHLGHIHVHPHGAHVHAKAGGASVSALNGFTLAAFLCWFGGAGYLLQRYSPIVSVLVMVAAVAAGLLGAALLYVALFKLLIPHERVLTAEDTRMEGMLARVSDEVRAMDGIGEILFSQAGSRRSAPARSADGTLIPRGTEVVVLRYERGVATIRPLNELEGEPSNGSLSSGSLNKNL